MRDLRRKWGLARRQLTDEQVAEIRASAETNLETGKRYGISAVGIWKIRKGILYRLTRAEAEKGE
jgi:hypothetical protein